LPPWWLWVNHKKQRVAKHVGSYETALKAKKTIDDQLALGLFVFPQREKKSAKAKLPTLKEYYEKFDRIYLKTAVRESTAERYERCFRIHILRFCSLLSGGKKSATQVQQGIRVALSGGRYRT
jgi:hypothetical protein